MKTNFYLHNHLSFMFSRRWFIIAGIYQIKDHGSWLFWIHRLLAWYGFRNGFWTYRKL